MLAPGLQRACNLHTRQRAHLASHMLGSCNATCMLERILHRVCLQYEQWWYGGGIGGDRLPVDSAHLSMCTLQ